MFTTPVDNSLKTGTVVFSARQRAVTPGQIAVLYKKEQMLGGEIIV